MKKIKFDVLLIVLLLAATGWAQWHALGLPLLMCLGLIPLFGSVIANPKKRTNRQPRIYKVDSAQ